MPISQKYISPNKFDLASIQQAASYSWCVHFLKMKLCARTILCRTLDKTTFKGKSPCLHFSGILEHPKLYDVKGIMTKLE